MKYILQYVNSNLLAHFLFLTSSYVLVSVLYNKLEAFSTNFPRLGNLKLSDTLGWKFAE